MTILPVNLSEYRLITTKEPRETVLAVDTTITAQTPDTYKYRLGNYGHIAFSAILTHPLNQAQLDCFSCDLMNQYWRHQVSEGLHYLAHQLANPTAAYRENPEQYHVHLMDDPQTKPLPGLAGQATEVAGLDLLPECRPTMPNPVPTHCVFTGYQSAADHDHHWTFYEVNITTPKALLAAWSKVAGEYADYWQQWTTNPPKLPEAAITTTKS